MPSKRAPWWMYIVAGSFLGFMVLFSYQRITGPSVFPGFEGDFKGQGVYVLSVSPGGAESQAGLAAGDTIEAVNGKTIHSIRDWQDIRSNTEVGQAQRWEIERGDKRLKLTVEIPPPDWKERFSTYLGIENAYNVFILTSLILGLVVAFRRPFDPAARMGAWVLAAASVTFGLPDGWAATWRHLPAVFSFFLWIPEVSRFVADAILLSFFLIFPRKVFRARWPWLVIWVPALALVPWRVKGIYEIVYNPWTDSSVPAWVFAGVSLRSVVYLVASLIVLVWSYRALEDANQRRRARVVLAGLVLSTLGVVGWVSLGSVPSLNFWHRIVEFITYAMWLAFPVSFAFAILRHRMFDLGVMVRQGLQYAFARNVLISFVPVMGIILLSDLLVHGDQPLLSVLTARGWVYATLGVLAFVAYQNQSKWMDSLDRRFFRERYDARRLLREVAEEALQSGSFDRAAEGIVHRIESALHPEFAAIMVKQASRGTFRALATSPTDKSPPEFNAESKFVNLLRVLGKPLEVMLGEIGWLDQQLSHEETDFLRRARVDLLVPISLTKGQTEAILVLGAKRSEEPYAREDQELLAAIAASMALLIEKPVPQTSHPTGTLEECPQCGTCYDTGSGRCAQDSATLVPSKIPRLLVDRYRLDRARGRGGMGAVYEALDTALERRVAVKVIRDGLVGNVETAERFKREARAAAGFTHPNVVTIYDYGVDAGKRAFLVMELLAGFPLRDEMKRLGRMAVPRTLAILKDVCAAVEAAHRRQLVHRDLKPENVFLTRQEAAESAKVLDFGIAKFLPASDQETADTGSGALVGTVRYMCPEQLRGGKVDTGWDIWALAVVTYELLAGSHPFRAVTAAEFHSAILSGQVTPITEHVSSAPASWIEFFSRALSLDPSRRPASAAQFLCELELALS